MSKLELADMLERFVGDAPNCGDYEWDDFTSTKAEPELEPYRQRLAVQSEGLIDTGEIRQIISELRN
ncbi:hypothetical protein [Sphingomonas sp.]|uniref:hypothetical protein n=1 Tax=Sphingomonas sp. TaxID=28214 RepID=UPI003AFFF78C